MNRPTAAETFWGIEELRYELFQWDFPKKELVGMMVLAKRSLPEVAKALYREVENVEIVAYLEGRGCSSIHQTLPFPITDYQKYNSALLRPFINVRNIRICEGDPLSVPTSMVERDDEGRLCRGGWEMYGWSGHHGTLRSSGQVLFLDLSPLARCWSANLSPGDGPLVPTPPPPMMPSLQFINLSFMSVDELVRPDLEIPPIIVADDVVVAIQPSRLQQLESVSFDVPHPPQALRHFQRCSNLKNLDLRAAPGEGVPSLLKMVSVLGEGGGLHLLYKISFRIPSADAHSVNTQTREGAALPPFSSQAFPALNDLAVELINGVDRAINGGGKDRKIVRFIQAHIVSTWELRSSGYENTGNLRRVIARTLRFSRQKGRQRHRVTRASGPPSIQALPGWRLLKGKGPEEQADEPSEAPTHHVSNVSDVIVAI